MSMEGTTRIELTDVRTGRTEVREHKNRVTGAVQEIFTPLGLYNQRRDAAAAGRRGRQQPACLRLWRAAAA